MYMWSFGAELINSEGTSILPQFIQPPARHQFLSINNNYWCWVAFLAQYCYSLKSPPPHPPPPPMVHHYHVFLWPALFEMWITIHWLNHYSVESMVCHWIAIYPEARAVLAANEQPGSCCFPNIFISFYTSGWEEVLLSEVSCNARWPTITSQ